MNLKRLSADAKITHWIGTGIPTRLHIRSDLHIARKLWHMVMGIVIAYLYWAGFPKTLAIVVLGSVLGCDLLLETARLRIPAFNERVIKVWGPFMRACEIDKLSGVPHYLASTVLVIAIFPKPVAILSILYLACGDPLASLFGILYGDKGTRFKSGKSMIGTLAGIITCATVTLLFLGSLGVVMPTLLALTLVGGFVGGTAELVPLEIDDNFTIPVISGFALWLAFMVVGI